jgi:BNR/Asp-box repeat
MKFFRLLTLVSMFAAAPSMLAEVFSTSFGPDSLRVIDVVEAEEEEIAYLVSDGDIFRTNDAGTFWTRQVPIQGASDVAWGGSVTYAVDIALAVRDDDSFWQTETIALPAGIVNGLRLAADDSDVYMIAVDAAGDTSLWSLAHGTTAWSAITGGLPADPLLDVATSASGVLVATATQGIWFSADAGVSFSDAGQPDVVLVDWATDTTGSIVILTDGTDIHHSTAGGSGSWTMTDLGGGETITGVGIGADGELLAGTDRSGLFASAAWPTFTADRDDGRLDSVQSNVPVAIGAIGRVQGDLLVGTLGRSVFIDRGPSVVFTEPSLPPEGGEVLSFARGRDQSESVLGTLGGGVFLTLDSGADWSPANSGFGARDVHALLADGEIIYAGTEDGIRKADTISTLQWQTVGDATLGGVTVSALTLVDSRLVAASSAGIYYSDDAGETWTLGSAAIADYLADDGNALWAAGPGVFMTSADDGATWSAAGTTGVTGTPRRVFAAVSDLFLAVNDGLYRSSDQAASWTEVDTGITPTTAEADYLLVFSDPDESLYVSEATGGFRVSFDDGVVWRALYLGAPNAGGGALPGIRAYSLVIPDPVEEGETLAVATLHFAMGSFGMYGSSVADIGDTDFLIHPGAGLVSLALDEGNLASVTVTGNHPDRATAPAGVLFSLGFYRITIASIEPGQAVTVSMTFPTGASPDRFYKYGPTADDATDHWYDFSFDGTTGAQFDGEVVTLFFVDGERGDSDLTADGVIVDPGAPGYFVGTDSGGGVPSPILLGALLLLIARRIYSAR